MSARSPSEIEWKRLRARLRRKGPKEVTAHVIARVAVKTYPLWCAYKLSWLLMKRGEFGYAGRLLKSVRQTRERHPLIDALYGRWLWCTSSRTAAIRFL